MDVRTRSRHLRAIVQVALTASLPLGCTDSLGVADAAPAPGPDGCGYSLPDARAYHDQGIAPDAMADASVCARRYEPTNRCCAYEQTVVFPCGLPDELAHLDARVEDRTSEGACRALCAGSSSSGTFVAGMCQELTPRDARPFVVHCGTCGY